MALQTNLNEKDKKTIAWVLFAALIFVIAWFLIRPTVSAIRTTDDKIEQAEITRTQYRIRSCILQVLKPFTEKP